MSRPDITYHSNDADTSYRLRPNPDAEPGTGFVHGAVLEWSDHMDSSWNGYFFVSPEAMEALGLALIEAAKDVKA